ncbi:MAG: hypothetical protein JWP81_1628 [Ferruginibacter sp.]|nr:hypothetical protein [Ferruginibacter sp.]
MLRIKPGVDIISDILKETFSFYPASKFIESLLYQYQERGSLSKKQLEGLYNKASGVSSIPAGKLATLEAIILKKPTRYKSPVPQPVAPTGRDTIMEERISDILVKYPQHKRVLFIKLKFENNEPISALEKSEIDRFHKLLTKGGS